MRRQTVLWAVGVILAVNHVHESTCWGGFNSIGNSISRGFQQVQQEVSRGVAQVHREVERIGTQIADVATDTVRETERLGQTVEHAVKDVFQPPEPEQLEYPIMIEPQESIPLRTKCWPLGGITVDFSCTLAGNSVNCSAPLEVGTVATSTCKPGYKPPEDSLGQEPIVCNATLQWSHTVRRCMPDCGKRNTRTDDVTAIDVRSLDRSELTGEFPWHVGIYKVTGADAKKLLCAGSLITQKLVLTAAVCFWDGLTNTKQDDVTSYKLAAGKYIREWSVDEAGLQRRDAAAILMHERFRGRVRVSAYNLAVVKVAEQFTFSPTVHVVCMDWHNAQDEARLAASEDGMVSSWGDSSIPYSDVNTPAQLHYRPFLECSDTIAEEYQVYLTSDKMCGTGLYVNTTLCPVDSGVGFVFPLDTVRGPRYYLRGVSTGVLSVQAEGLGICDQQPVALFTQLYGYREWLRQIILDN